MVAVLSKKVVKKARNGVPGQKIFPLILEEKGLISTEKELKKVFERVMQIFQFVISLEMCFPNGRINFALAQKKLCHSKNCQAFQAAYSIIKEEREHCDFISIYKKPRNTFSKTPIVDLTPRMRIIGNEILEKYGLS